MFSCSFIIALPMVCPLTWIIGLCAEIMMTSVCKQCCSGQEVDVIHVLLAVPVDCVDDTGCKAFV